MNGNLIMFGWDRPHPGREAASQQHFQDFVGYLTGQQQAGAIQSFEAVFLDPHSGDLNGFFLIRGEPDKLDVLLGSDEWLTNVVRADLHLDGLGVVRGATGDMIPQRFQLWSSLVPK
jgi:hypothetical protein